MRNKKKKYNVVIYMSGGNKDNNILTVTIDGKSLPILKGAYENKKVVELDNFIIDMGKVLYMSYREI